MNSKTLLFPAVLAACLASGSALTQVNEVPMQGLGNEWVKQLDLKGDMEWEWIQTYPDEVYFATQREIERAGDVVTMWTRIEYRAPKMPGPHLSLASRDQWDCANRRKANVRIAYYTWHNLEDANPSEAVSSLTRWEGIEPASLGEKLLDYACNSTAAGT